MTDWEKLLTEATSGVQEACASIGARADRSRTIGKGAAGDDTLVADREAERLIVDSLLSVQNLRVLSEEAGEVGPKGSRYVAIVDPVDGSSNFSRGIPFYCASVCIVDGRKLKDAKCALVRNLVSGEIYYAEKGAGAYKNGAELHPSRTQELSGAVVAVDVSKAKPEAVRRLEPLTTKVSRQVHFGANALEMCMVAEGVVDAFVDLRNRMRITDVAGAYLMAKEAGAVLSDEEGEELDPPLELDARLRVVASANGRLHENILRELAAFKGRRI